MSANAVKSRVPKRLITFTGAAAADLARKPRKPQQMKRVLYRRGDISDADLLQVIDKIGVDRVWRAVERLTSPELPLAEAAL
jgi:hypothetical protein